ncbi:MAG: 1-acyl-sn-glycerol-3-phosphate acyltransferase [Anaerolineae bacterium]|nr:1-acyl-sn-glycerol-3-phosphate acyltransferase [Anaerolineae bacterium]
MRRLNLQYPRRTFIRGAFKFMGRAIGSLLARPIINGLENLPSKGPLILVGNHVAVIEAGMMATYVPYPIELMAAGDIPLDPRYAWMADLYGIIPIKRGSMDREGMDMALEILHQGGVLGLFPEGGIWETNLKQARQGVAWLSNKAQAPVVPIGFGGIEGAVSAITKLRRPRLVMNIGRMIPPVSLDIPGKSRKQAMMDAANHIMEQVKALLPEEERRLRQPKIMDESFDFHMIAQDAHGAEVALLSEAMIADRWGLGKFFHRPVMLDVFTRNLRLPVQPLNDLAQPQRFDAIADSVQAILNYLEGNPYFLAYRFGNEEGGAMERGLVQLRDAMRALEARYPGGSILLHPMRRYTLIATKQQILEDRPGSIQEI